MINIIIIIIYISKYGVWCSLDCYLLVNSYFIEKTAAAAAAGYSD